MHRTLGRATTECVSAEDSRLARFMAVQARGHQWCTSRFRLPCRAKRPTGMAEAEEELAQAAMGKVVGGSASMMGAGSVEEPQQLGKSGLGTEHKLQQVLRAAG